MAVITDGATASAGEAVAIAFRGRSGTRSFGTPTCGLTTSNTPFALSDGSTLWLATSFDADRTRRIYDGPIAPDEIVMGADAVLARAVEWLRAR